MSGPCSCCGCVLQDDYGTSLVTGDGSHLDPFVVEVVDPAFLRPSVLLLAVNQSVPANTPTLISFIGEGFDTASMWDIGTPTSIVIPHTGLYMMGARAALAVTQTLGITMEFLKNGVSIHTHIFSASEVFGVEGNTSYVFFFAMGDTLQLRVNHAHSLGNANVTAALWACYLGRGPV